METSTNITLDKVSTNSETEGKYLTFFTDKQLFAVPIADVVQIVSIQEITPVPEFPAYAKGIINLRGNIVPIIDVRLRFGKQEIPYTERTCIIVANINEWSVGFIVDGVDEVTDIHEDEFSPPPRMFQQDGVESYLIGVGRQKDKVILLIDTAKILSDKDMSTLREHS